MKYCITKKKDDICFDLISFFRRSKTIKKIGTFRHHSLSQSWLIRVVAQESVADIVSESVVFDSWNESANIMLGFFGVKDECEMRWTYVDFFVKSVDIFYYTEDLTRVCCGLEFHSKNGDFIKIFGASIAGSLTVASNLFDSKFSPEIEGDDSRVEKVSLII